MSTLAMAPAPAGAPARGVAPPPPAVVEDDDEVIILDSGDEGPSAQRASSGRGASSSRLVAPAAAQRRRRPRPAAGAAAGAAAGGSGAGADIVDLTSDAGDDLQIVRSTVVPRQPTRGAKRPRIPTPQQAASAEAALQPHAGMLAMFSPGKRQRVAQLLNPAPLARPAPEPEPEGPKCGICMEPMGGSHERHMASGSCGHVYCYDCLVEAVRAQKKCPTCRKTMQVRQIHKIHL